MEGSVLGDDDEGYDDRHQTQRDHRTAHTTIESDWSRIVLVDTARLLLSVHGTTALTSLTLSVMNE